MKKLFLVLLGSLSITACQKETVVRETQMSPVQTVAVPSVAQAEVVASRADGTVDGGGGKGILCTENGSTKLEILDFYEAEQIYGLQLRDLKITDETQMLTELTKMFQEYWSDPGTLNTAGSPEIRDSLNKYFNKFLSKVRFVQSDKHLKLTDDSLEAIVEKNCEVVQIAVYYNESTLIVDKELWDKLSWQSKAGLLAHELIYRTARQTGAKDSVQTRRLVSYLFSDTKIIGVDKRVKQTDSKLSSCDFFENEVEVGSGWIFSSETEVDELSKPRIIKGSRLQIDFLNFRPIIFNTSIFISEENYAKMFGQNGKANEHFNYTGWRSYPQLEVATFANEDITDSLYMRWSQEKGFTLSGLTDTRGVAHTVTVECKVSEPVTP